jgi:hypothetical protein
VTLNGAAAMLTLPQQLLPLLLQQLLLLLRMLHCQLSRPDTLNVPRCC